MEHYNNLFIDFSTEMELSIPQTNAWKQPYSKHGE